MKREESQRINEVCKERGWKRSEVVKAVSSFKSNSATPAQLAIFDAVFSGDYVVSAFVSKTVEVI